MLNIGGKYIKLVFDLGAWEEIEEEYGSIEAMSDQLQSGQHIIKNVLILIAIMARGEDGEHCITRQELRKCMQPSDIKHATEEILAAISAGMGMETAIRDDDAPVDVVLEEISKKKQPGS